jgi:hypothetical protein
MEELQLLSDKLEEEEEEELQLLSDKQEEEEEEKVALLDAWHVRDVEPMCDSPLVEPTPELAEPAVNVGEADSQKIWTASEDALLGQLVEKFRHHNRPAWKQIAKHLVGRSESMARNRWSRRESALKFPGKFRCRACASFGIVVPRRGHSCPFRRHVSRATAFPPR